MSAFATPTSEVHPVVSQVIQTKSSWRIGMRFGVSLVVLVGLLSGLTTTSALTLNSFSTRFSGNVAGDFAITGNTIVTCSTVAGELGAASCADARKRQGSLVDNDNHFMRTHEVPVAGLPPSEVINSSSNSISVPAGSHILYAELFWSGSLLRRAGEIAAVSPSDKDRVLLAVGDEDCSAPARPCDVSARPADVVQEDLGTNLGQYRASAEVTSQLQKVEWSSSRGIWQSLITVANIQTTQGRDKSAGWSLAVVFTAPGYEMRHVQLKGGFGVVARRTDVSVRLDGFLAPEVGDVQSSVGVVGFDGDLGDATDSIYLEQDSNQTVLEDTANPQMNIANSSVSSDGSLSNFLNNDSLEQSSNTFGTEADRINTINALAHGSTDATLVMTSEQDTWYPAAVAFSTVLPSADVVLEKFVSKVDGSPSDEVNVGDSLTYTVRATNAGNGLAHHLVVRDALPDDMSLTASSGTDCDVVSPGHICKVVDALAPNKSVSIVVRGTINGHSEAAPGSFTNQATGQYSSHLGKHDIVSNVVQTRYGLLQVDLSSQLSFAKTYLQSGDTGVLHATITNFGPAADGNPSSDLLITHGVAEALSLPKGCVKVTATHIVCSARAFGISTVNSLAPGMSRTVQISLRPAVAMSQLVVKQVVHTSVAAGDSNPSNDTSYAQVAINHPPVAKPMRISARSGGETVLASLSSLVSDPDSDSLHIRVASALHGYLSHQGLSVRFVPPARWHGTQWVPYFISDGKGGRARSHIVIVVSPTTTTEPAVRPTTGPSAGPDGGDGNSVGPSLTAGRKCFVIRAGC